MKKTGLFFFGKAGVEFYSMLRALHLIFSTMLLASCSIYSSAGRKQFEQKAPDSIQAFSLQGCRKLSAAELWLREEFPSRSQELVELHPDYEVWGRTLEDGQVEISVLTHPEGGSVGAAAAVSITTTESCAYRFESTSTWLAYKDHFLSELSRSLVNLE